MAELYYFSKKQDLLKHLFNNNISGVTLLLFSATPDFLSVYNNKIEILKNTPVLKSTINYLSNEILSPHNYISPSIYLNLINEIYWVVPEWTKKHKIHDIYWGNNTNTPLHFIEENIPSHKQDKYIKYEKDNINKFFSKENNLYISTEFDNSTLLNKIQNENKPQNQIPIYKMYIDELQNKLIKKDFIVLFSFDYLICSGYNMFNIELPNTTREEITNNAVNIMDLLASLKDSLKIICLSQNPDYTPDNSIIIIEDIFKNNLTNAFQPFVPILGPFFYSKQFTLELQNLLEKIKLNFLNDPRHSNNNSPGIINNYLNEEILFSINRLSEPYYKLNYMTLNNISTTKKKAKRNYYDFYLKLLETNKITSLKDKLTYFINAQNNASETQDSLKSYFDILIYELQHFINRLSLNYSYSNAHNVTNEYTKLIKLDEEIVEKTMKNIDNYFKKLGKEIFGKEL